MDIFTAMEQMSDIIYNKMNQKTEDGVIMISQDTVDQMTEGWGVIRNFVTKVIGMITQLKNSI